MRIGIAKPDYGIVGGFELVLQRVADGLRQRGHAVEWLTVDVASLPTRPFGVEVPSEVWQAQPEFFRYLQLVEAFNGLRCDDFDVVMSTQPPSFAVDHPRQLALFSHHHRIYYDLSDVYVAAGFAEHPYVHAEAQALVRRVDDRFLTRPKHFLATSEHVRERLRLFTGLEGRVGIYHAGIGPALGGPMPESRFGDPICVSRHEFPKRTELFVHAMKLLPGMTGIAVGEGGRLPYVRSLDARLSRPDVDVAAVDDRELWLCSHAGHWAEVVDSDSNVRFVGRVPDAELSRLYSEALCVVAPAYLEDYGLTAIEAMHFGKPVIVCEDGGGLLDFVEDGLTGFVVEPNGPAIAAAVRRLDEDRDLARRLGENGRDAAAQFTWERSLSEIEAGLDQVLS